MTTECKNFHLNNFNFLFQQNLDLSEKPKTGNGGKKYFIEKKILRLN
jgi:hypothetical protein